MNPTPRYKSGPLPLVYSAPPILRYLMLGIAGILGVVLLAGFCFDLAYAAGAGPSVAITLGAPAVDDAGGWTVALYAFLRDGAHLPAVGAALVLIVWALRNGIGQWVPWFKTPSGGYVLGYGTSAILYVGTALASGGGVTMGLLGQALGVAWTAAGGWEHFRDSFPFFKPKTGASGAVMLALVFLFACSGCPSVTDTKPGGDIIDCTKADASKLEALAAQLLPLVTGGKPDWTAIETQAESAGVEIGGCVLAALVQQYLSKPKATPTEATWPAHDALEHFRTVKAHGATFRTTSGDL